VGSGIGSGNEPFLKFLKCPSAIECSGELNTVSGMFRDVDEKQGVWAFFDVVILTSSLPRVETTLTTQIFSKNALMR
jgi:hypothetical protein